MPNLNERLEKQMEGTNLALAAVAEILQKMDVRFSKEEQKTVQKQEQSAQAAARAELIKNIAGEVVSVIKGEGGESEQGMDVDGKERKAKGTGGTPQNADDSESSVTPTSKIEEQQNTIQAMKKLLKNLEEGQHPADDKKHEEKGGMAYKQEDDSYGDEAEDIPVDEEEEEFPSDEEGDDVLEDDKEPTDIKAMQKQFRAMKKEMKATKANMQKAVQTEAENRLRKMGFREETSLKAPKLTQGLGLEDLTPIAKAEGDIAGQLVDMSYQELRRLQQKIDTGQTDGLPRELIGN